MPEVKFTSNLKRFFPELSPLSCEAKTVAEVLEYIEKEHRGLKDYIIDESGALRKHVNIFIGNNMVKDRLRLEDKLESTDQVYIMQALSGG